MPFPQAQKHQHPLRDTPLRGRFSRVEIPDISPRIWSRTGLGIVPLSTTVDSFEIDYRDPALLNDLQEAIKRARLVNELRLRMLAYGTHLEKSRFTNKLDQALANNLEMLKTTADQKGTEIGAVILPKHLTEGQQGDLKKIPSSHSSTQRLGDSFALSRESKQAQLIREVGVLYGRQLALVLDQQRKGLNPLVATPEKDIVTIYETIEAERAYGAVARRPREGSSLSYYVPTKEKVTEGLDPERVRYANQKLWENNPNLNGRSLTLKAEDAHLREEWWNYYYESDTDSDQYMYEFEVGPVPDIANKNESKEESNAGVYLTSHELYSTGYSHVALMLIPEDQEKYKDREGFLKGDKKDGLASGLWYTTVSAGPGKSGGFSKLTSTRNRESDDPSKNIVHSKIDQVNGLTTDEFIEMVIEYDSRYNGEAPYDYYRNPTVNLEFEIFEYEVDWGEVGDTEGWNSNSYISGILEGVGATVEKPPIDIPLWEHPVPKAYFPE